MSEEAKPKLPEWMRDAVAAVGDSLVRDIVADNRASPRSAPATPPVARGSSEAVVPLGPRPVSEVELIDRLVAKWVGGPNEVRWARWAR
jgi:hypothetical protein